MSKRLFDILFAMIGLILFGWLILFCWVLSAIETRKNGFFTQQRVGMNGNLFTVIKIRTMKQINGYETNVTTSYDPRITRLGKFFRSTKLDELPQLFNVLIGKMSFVGPRPDVPGYADKLSDENKIILSLRPGITGPASLYFRNEEELLKKQTDPQSYNDRVIWPEKVRLNRAYALNNNLFIDIYLILATIFPFLKIDFKKLIGYEPDLDIKKNNPHNE